MSYDDNITYPPYPDTGDYAIHQDYGYQEVYYNGYNYGSDGSATRCDGYVVDNETDVLYKLPDCWWW